VVDGCRGRGFLHQRFFGRLRAPLFLGRRDERAARTPHEEARAITSDVGDRDLGTAREKSLAEARHLVGGEAVGALVEPAVGCLEEV